MRHTDGITQVIEWRFLNHYKVEVSVIDTYSHAEG